MIATRHRHGASARWPSTLCWLAGGFGNARPATGTWCALCREQGAKVFATDIEPHDGLDEVFDFLSPGQPKGLERYDGIVTNSAWGKGNRTAVAFVEAGLRRIAGNGGFLAFLLPADFDSAVTRLHLFHHSYFAARIVLTARPVWFERTDGVKAAPKENCAWFVWLRPVLRSPGPPIVRHATARPNS